MVRLNLGRNRLDKVPSEALSNLRYLEILDMTENEIAKIEAGDFRGKIFLVPYRLIQRGETRAPK